MSSPLASIDVGTNSVLLTVARLRADGGLEPLEQHATVTRLGQGVDQTGRLHPDAEERTLRCLADYRAILDRYEGYRAAAVGTSALRDAEGGASFLERARRILGFPVEVISGAREAELTFGGALLDLQVTGNACVFDIGGGSTELIIGNAATGEINSSISLNVGSVRLTERLGLSDPPTRDQWTRVRAVIAEQLSLFDLSAAQGLTLVGVAGTVTTLAAILAEMDSYDSAGIHGATILASELAELSERLFFMSVAERRTLAGLSPGRADVIGAGAVLCSLIVERSGAEKLVVSDRGVRYGLLRALAAN